MAKMSVVKMPARHARPGKTKLGGWVSTSAAELARDLAYWDRSTLGEVLEFAVRLLVSTREEVEGSPAPRRPRSRRRLPAGRPPDRERIGTTKLGGWVSTSAAELARDLAYWDRSTLGEVLELAVRLLVSTREEEAGSRVPRRPRSRRRLPVGRPPKSD